MYHLNGYFVKKNLHHSIDVIRVYYRFIPWNIHLRLHHKMHNVAVK